MQQLQQYRASEGNVLLIIQLLIGASLSEPHIAKPYGCARIVYCGLWYVCRSTPYHCTEAARNVLHCKVCVLKICVYNVHNLSHSLNQQKLGEKDSDCYLEFWNDIMASSKINSQCDSFSELAQDLEQ